MKKFELISIVEEYSSLEEMTDNDKHLIKLATDALATAYAPYSQFQVGAALLLEDGTAVLGSNQENAAYPSGLCADGGGGTADTGAAACGWGSDGFGQFAGGGGF